MLPLKPILLFLFSTILIIPLMPSGLYLAEGLVISSICLIEEEGICCNNWAASILVGFPSIRIFTFEFPLKLIALVCGSTLTEGMLFMISDAVAPAEIKSFPTLITFRSIFCSIIDFSLTISTLFSSMAFSSKAIVFRLMFLLLEESVMDLLMVLYPMN